MDDSEAMAALGPIARFLPGADLGGAAGVLAYIQEMLAGQASPGDVAGWCYEFAAAGVPYQDWPDMACARLAEGEGGDAELRMARRASLAEALIDRGEIETLVDWRTPR